MIKRFSYIAFLLFWAICTTLSAQDDLLKDLEAEDPNPEKATPSNLVKGTFHGTRLVNFHTVEVPAKRNLEYRIVHRFGNIGGDNAQNFGEYTKNMGDNLIGFDGGASIRMGFEYSYDGRLALGLGRSNVNKMVDMFAKYQILQQTLDNKMPITMAWLSSFNMNTTRDEKNEIFPKYYHRYNYVHSLMIARKFSDKFSMQLSPTYIHYNLRDNSYQKNDMFSVIGMARIKVSKMSSLTVEYAPRLTKYDIESEMKRYQNILSFGWDIETGGGHVFQMFISNSRGIIESENIPYTVGEVKYGEFRIGFNISRAFVVGRR
jgi:hypothetical protein